MGYSENGFRTTELGTPLRELEKTMLGTRKTQSALVRIEESLLPRTRIGRISTDIFNPCLSVSSVQSVFYRNPATIDDDKKPQMNADERRYFPASDFSKIIHRKGRKERKAMQQESLRPLRSLRLNVFSTPAHERTPPQPALQSRLNRAGDWL